MAKSTLFSKNRILSRLSAGDKALLEPDLEPVPLKLRQVLEVPNKPITHSYFINYGLASIIAFNSHKRIEVGLIGCEGLPAFQSCWTTIGLRTKPSSKLPETRRASQPKNYIRQSRKVAPSNVRCWYAYSFMSQTANTALSNGTATLEE